MASYKNVLLLCAFVLWNQILRISCLPAPKCQKGSYLSRHVGDCVDCPESPTECETLPSSDKINCRRACPVNGTAFPTLHQRNVTTLNFHNVTTTPSTKTPGTALLASQQRSATPLSLHNATLTPSTRNLETAPTETDVQRDPSTKPTLQFTSPSKKELPSGLHKYIGILKKDKFLLVICVAVLGTMAIVSVVCGIKRRDSLPRCAGYFLVISNPPNTPGAPDRGEFGLLEIQETDKRQTATNNYN